MEIIKSQEILKLTYMETQMQHELPVLALFKCDAFKKYIYRINRLISAYMQSFFFIHANPATIKEENFVVTV